MQRATTAIRICSVNGTPPSTACVGVHPTQPSKDFFILFYFIYFFIFLVSTVWQFEEIHRSSLKCHNFLQTARSPRCCLFTKNDNAAVCGCATPRHFNNSSRQTCVLPGQDFWLGSATFCLTFGFILSLPLEN